MADHEIEKPWTPPRVEGLKSQKVAVIGAGPAGLTAALRLAQLGYPVTVFEKLPVAGGMMAVGIPSTAAARRAAGRDRQHPARGVELKLNQALGKDFTVDGLLGKQASARCPGRRRAQEPQDRHRGEELPGVMAGTEFLRDCALGQPPSLKASAWPSLARRGGHRRRAPGLAPGAAKVHVVYRRSREDMPAWGEEVNAAWPRGSASISSPIRCGSWARTM